MKQVRHNVFETNSSSVHAITICTQETFDKWINKELYFYRYKRQGYEQFFTWDEMIQFIHKVLHAAPEDIEDLVTLKKEDNEEFEQLLHEYDFYTPEMYEDYNCEFESYEKHFTTPGGEEIVVFGYYGESR